MNEQRLPLKVLKYMRNNKLGWVKRVKSIFLELDLDITSNDISHIPLQTVEEHLVKKDTHQWKLSVASKPKLRTYALFKINLKTELYVSLLIPKCKRSIYMYIYIYYIYVYIYICIVIVVINKLLQML